MAEVLLRVTDTAGLFDEERITIPVQAGGPSTGVEVVVLADPGASRDNFALSVLGGFVVLTARSNGWYTVSRGGEVVVDRTLVDNRPDNTSARRPYWFRLRVQTYRGKRDIYAKVWPDNITQPDGTVVDFPEPGYWDSLWYQDADPAFLAATGPTVITAPGWVWQNLTVSDVPSPAPPRSALPDRPNLADDFGIYHDGRDQSLELAAATRNLTGTIYAESLGRYGIEQSVFFNDWHNVVLYGRAAEFVRSPQGIAQGVYLAFERTRELSANAFTVRGAFQWRDSQVWFAPGIRTLDVQRATFQNFDIFNVAGDFALIRDGSVDVTLEQFRMEVAGRQGIAITNADNTIVRDGFLKWVRRSCIDLEPYIWSRYVRGTRIERVTGETFTNYFVAGRGASDLYMADCVAVGGLGWMLLGGRGMRPQGSRTIAVDAPQAGEAENTPSGFWALQSEASDEALQNGADALWTNRWLHMNSGPAAGHWRPIIGHDSDTFTPYTITLPDGRIRTLTNHRARIYLERPLPIVPQPGDSFQAPRPASGATILRNRYDWEDPDWDRGASAGTEVWAHDLTLEGNTLRFRGTGLTELYIPRGRVVGNVISQPVGGQGLLINTGGLLDAIGRPLYVTVEGNVNSAGNPVPVVFR